MTTYRQHLTTAPNLTVTRPGPGRVSLHLWHVTPASTWLGQYTCLASSSLAVARAVHNFTGDIVSMNLWGDCIAEMPMFLIIKDNAKANVLTQARPAPLCSPPLWWWMCRARRGATCWPGPPSPSTPWWSGSCSTAATRTHVSIIRVRQL